MELSALERVSEDHWQLAPTGKMRVPVVFYADRRLVESMDDKVRQQACNVASLPGIVKASYVMPDGH